MPLEEIEAALARHGKLIAKPARDGSSYGLIFVNSSQDLVAVRNAASTEEYLIEPFISGVEATCGVLEQSDGSVMSLPPIEIIPAADGFGFDYRAKYLAKATQEICPGRFAPEISAQIMAQALSAHRALSCSGLFPFGLHRLRGGAGLSGNQHPAGADQGLAVPQGAEGAVDRIRRFPARPDRAGRGEGQR